MTPRLTRNHHATDRHLALVRRRLGLLQGQLHVLNVKGVTRVGQGQI